MKLGFFTMPIHPVEKDWRQSLQEDREAFLLADELGFTEGYVGEHVTDKAENITSSIAFLAWIAAATKRIRLGTGTVNMPNTHPATVAASIAMLDHMLEGRLIFGISPGGLLSRAWSGPSGGFSQPDSLFTTFYDDTPASGPTRNPELATMALLGAGLLGLGGGQNQKAHSLTVAAP